ncbi:MAG: hypothetical protein H0T53_08220 [Herpetosiphonaceae bacterium]|nr:hypothetical protein [Herpetosiphonaceae bacterium]
MHEHTFHYDDSLDTLLVTFSPAEETTTVVLNEYMSLQIGVADQQVARITLCDYSLLSNETKFGPRYFPLTGLKNVSNDTRTRVLDLLSQTALSHILSLCVYVPSLVDTLPIVSVKPVFPLKQPNWPTNISHPQPASRPAEALASVSLLS